MIRYQKLTFLLLVFLSFGCQTEIPVYDTKLWYDKPATDWYQALPIGNGTLGAMVYGGIKTEQLQLNENTLYSGEPGRRHIEIDVTKNLEKVKTLIKEGKLDEVNKIVGDEWIGRAQPCYQPFGNLFIELDHSEDVQDYRRELDISKAICRTSYSVDNVKYQRETFASFPDQVIVTNLTSNGKEKISCTIELQGAHPTANSSVENDVIIMKGQAPALALRRTIEKVQDWGQEWMYPELFDENGQPIPGRETTMYGDILDGEGTFYEGRVGVVLEGGSLQVKGNKLVISNADNVKIILSGDTSYNDFDKSPSKEGVDPSILATANLEKALPKSYKQLKKDHLADYKNLFNRVSFSLGEMTEQSKLPTDKRLEMFSQGGDPSLAALFMQHARYLTIAASRPGGQPINLQGMWNDLIIPPWAGGYTMNINTQIYYWMTEAANLSECVEPNLRFTRELAVDGATHARESFGYSGWTAHHNTTIWRCAQPVDNAYCSFWPLAGGWLCQQIWTHYRYTKDKEFLKEYWPVLKGAAEFLNDWLILSEKGYYTTPIGSSPEHGYYPEGADYRTPFCEGATMDIMIIKELFTNCIAASEILGIDKEFARELSSKVNNLQPYKIGSKGQLLEWDKEYKEVDPQHRHISHLYAHSPGHEITKSKTPELFDAVKRTLEIRGDEGTGWAMAWKTHCWARLKDGNHAYDIVNNLFVPGGRKKAGLLPSLLASCPPFNIDGNFGAAAGIIEMLLQSHETKSVDGEEIPIIELLPALPEVWKEGEITGLRTANGFEVDIAWKEGKLVSAEIKSLLGDKGIVRFNGEDVSLNLDRGESIQLI
ncbi:MAG: glycoside hydrolase N-terminal domain-containing protein [Cytophagales bacterium]|nr:glycoside hydrolase N-terminal domain-containing protein [Cytophagales bacterium]